MEYRIKPEHNPDNYLKSILESIENYNAYERLDISNWLFEGYKKTKGVPEKAASRKAIFLEIISKWMQLFEDLAIVCLMFAGGTIKADGKPLIDTSKLPFEIFNYVSNKTILKFYKIAKKGLSKESIAKIYAFKMAEDLLKEGIISDKEYPYFKVQIYDSIESAQENFNKVARVYSRRKTHKDHGYGTLVKTYFSTKHGFKVLQNTQTTKILWDVKDSDVVLVKEVHYLKSGRKIMRVGLYEELQDKDIETLLNQMKGWSDVINEIVGAHLRRIENPNFLVPMVRKLKTEEILKSTKIKLSRNDPCPCESDLKYKKCCGLNS